MGWGGGRDSGFEGFTGFLDLGHRTNPERSFKVEKIDDQAQILSKRGTKKHERGTGKTIRDA